MSRITLMEWERGLLFTRGRFVRELGPGRHRLPRFGTTVHRMDVRPRTTTVPGQELLTADGLSIRVSLMLTWAIDAPRTYLTGAVDSEAALYAAAQVALRDEVGALPFDEVAGGRAGLGDGIRERLARSAGVLGIGVREVAVKDVMLPAELRRAAAETVLARENGRAELERARAEAAALRALANTGRLLEEHPSLLRLRMIQAASTPGTTLVLGTDPHPPQAPAPRA